MFSGKRFKCKKNAEIKKTLDIFFMFTLKMWISYREVCYGKKYECIEGNELGHLGGAWFASYVAYDINLRYSGLATLPVNSMNWQKRTHAASWAKRFKQSQMWVLMPNGSINKSSRTLVARNLLIKKGGISVHSYWALWMIIHCTRKNVMKNQIGLSFSLFRSLLIDSISFL